MKATTTYERKDIFVDYESKQYRVVLEWSPSHKWEWTIKDESNAPINVRVWANDETNFLNNGTRPGISGLQ